MRRLTEEAVLAGAFGFTTSRTNAHNTTQGEMVPGRFAEIDELTGIGAGLGAARAGTFGMNSDFEDETAEFAWITRLAKETGRPVWFLLTDRPTDPERWRRIMAGVHQARAEGASVTAQVAGRPVGVILGIATSFNPFALRERYKLFKALPLSERLCRLRDPAVRRAILDDRPCESMQSGVSDRHRSDPHADRIRHPLSVRYAASAEGPDWMPFHTPPQPGQTNPSGQRRSKRYSAHAPSVAKRP